MSLSHCQQQQPLSKVSKLSYDLVISFVQKGKIKLVRVMNLGAFHKKFPQLIVPQVV